MTNETKIQIMQTLQKVLTHYGLHSDVPASFKKRDELLERLKITHQEAWEKASGYVNAHITSDRIKNDKEKQLKKPEHWESEVKTAEQALLDSEEALKSFCNKRSISIN